MSQALRLTWGRSRRAKSATGESLTAVCAKFGRVVACCPILDHLSCLVAFASPAEAEAARSGLHGEQQPDLSMLRLFVDVVPLPGLPADADAAAVAAAMEVLAGDIRGHRHVNVLPPGASSVELPGIPGLLVIYNFLSEDEEAALLQAIDATSWTPQLSRRVQHYGHGFDYRTRTIAGTAGGGTGGSSGGDGGEGEEDAGAAASATAAPATAAAPVTTATDLLVAAAAPEAVIADRTAASALVPPTLPLSGALQSVADWLQCHGFIGDSIAAAQLDTGDSTVTTTATAVGAAGPLNDVALRAPLHGKAGADALLASLGISIQSNSNSSSDSNSDSSSSSSSTSYPCVNQVTINEYVPGRGIASHVDTHAGFQDGIVSLSLGSDAVMEFHRVAKEEEVPPVGAHLSVASAGRGAVYPVLLPRRSLVLLRGQARYAWSHSIPARKTDVIDGAVQPRGRRISATFRAVRTDACRCAWSSVCFDQAGGASEPSELYSPKLRAEREATQKLLQEGSSSSDSARTNNTSSSSSSGIGSGSRSTVATDAAAAAAEGSKTPALESHHVHALYDTIASHFSATRHSPWPRVEAYLRSLPTASLVLDIGCGNGKYLGLRRDLFTAGCDRSLPLAAICAERGYEVCGGDALRVPYRTGAADVALSIAVLHHISTRPRRLQLLAELLRVLRPGGQALIYAWAQEQGTDSKRAFASPDVLVPWALQRRFVSGSPEDIAAAGGAIDEGSGTVMFQRYCHVYQKGELESLVADAAAACGASFASEGSASAAATATATATGVAAAATATATGVAGPAALTLAGRPSRGDEGVVALPHTVPDAAIPPTPAALLRPAAPAAATGAAVEAAEGGSTAEAVSAVTATSSSSSKRKGKRGAAGGGGGGAGEGEGGVSLALDPITAALCTHAAGLHTRGSDESSRDSSGEASGPLVRILHSWWEKDNWCVLLQKD